MVSTNSRCVGQKKVFYGQRIPESSCGRKENVEIDIIITSRNSEGKVMQPIRISSRPSPRFRKRNQFSQFR